MQVEEQLARLSPGKDTMLTIGVFDGVHLGHQHLLSQLKKQAKKQNLLSGVVTFRQHPLEILSPQTELSFLTDIEERIRLLENEGVEIIISLDFTRDLAQLSTRQFISLLKKHSRMRGMVIGPDFTLGQNREGNFDALRALSYDMGFSVTAVSSVMINGEVVSSTAIRNALAMGDMRRVRNLVGRFFSLHGRVVFGAGRGVNLGFPTANLDVNAQQALPEDGVYVTRAHIDSKSYYSMTNIGRRPTFDGNKRTVEVYILDYHGDLYEYELTIDIIERLRDEKKFHTEEELKKQMAEDVKQGRAILDSRGKE